MNTATEEPTMQTQSQKPNYQTREDARRILQEKVEGPRPSFSSYDYDAIRQDAIWRLRWIDCAPEGARFMVAPLQDKRGVPLGGAFSENVGAGRAIREARARRGLDPHAPHARRAA